MTHFIASNDGKALVVTTTPLCLHSHLDDNYQMGVIGQSLSTTKAEAVGVVSGFHHVTQGFASNLTNLGGNALRCVNPAVIIHSLTVDSNVDDPSVNARLDGYGMAFSVFDLINVLHRVKGVIVMVRVVIVMDQVKEVVLLLLFRHLQSQLNHHLSRLLLFHHHLLLSRLLNLHALLIDHQAWEVMVVDYLLNKYPSLTLTHKSE